MKHQRETRFTGAEVDSWGKGVGNEHMKFEIVSRDRRPERRKTGCDCIAVFFKDPDADPALTMSATVGTLVSCV